MAKITRKKTTKAAATRRQKFKPSDYSSVGQNPIKLKKSLSADWDIDESRSLGRPRSRKVSTRKKPAVQSPPARDSQWTVRGVSAKSKLRAKKAAKEAGMPLGQWLDEAVSRQTEAHSAPDTDQRGYTHHLLEQVERRLAALERKKSFWDRLAEFVSRSK